MKDIECPYCEHEFDICTDDGHGCEESFTYHEQCPACKKLFTFTTTLSFHYEADKADCLNGAKHKLSFVEQNFSGKRLNFRCKSCDRSYDTENHPVLEELFFSNKLSSDFEFYKSAFYQFGLIIAKSNLEL